MDHTGLLLKLLPPETVRARVGEVRHGSITGRMLQSTRSPFDTMTRCCDTLSLSLYYMYIRDNGVSIGHFGHFAHDLQTCFGVLAVRSEV